MKSCKVKMMFQLSKSDRMDFVQENKCEEQSSRESVSGSTCKSDSESTCESDLESNEGHEEKGRKILTGHINRLVFFLFLLSVLHK